MKKVVINRCFGGYGLSKAAYEFLGIEWDDYNVSSGDAFSDDRENPQLVKCVETLKSKANGVCAALKVVKIPDDVEYYIDKYDGVESIHEKHRIWN